MSYRIASPRKPAPRIKQRVASYHTTKVIANKASYSKLRPKIGCHGNLRQHRWTPCNTWFLWPIQAHNPNGISIGLAVFVQMTAESHYTLQWDAPSPSKLPLLMGDLDPHLIHGSLGSLESSTRAASRLVQPFLQGSLVWQTDRQTTLLGNNRPHLYVRSTAMRPNNCT